MATADERKLARKEAKPAQRAGRWQLGRMARAALCRSEIADPLFSLASQKEGGTFVLGEKQHDLPAMTEPRITCRSTKRARDRIGFSVEWAGTETVLLASE